VPGGTVERSHAARPDNPDNAAYAVDVEKADGSHVVVLPLPVAADAEALVQSAERTGLQLKTEQAGFVQSYLLVPDAALSTPLPRESTEGRVLQSLLVIETSSEGAARAARATAAAAFDADPASGWLLTLGWKLTAAELA